MGMFDEGIKKAGGSGLFLDVDPGKKVRVRILDMPTVSAFANPDGRVSYRFNWPVWSYDEEAVKILSKGKSILTAVDAISEEYGDSLPMECDLVISRKGSGLDTEYTVVPGKNKSDLPDKWQKDVPDMSAAAKGSVPYAAWVKGTEPVAQTSKGGAAEQPPVEAYNNDPEAQGDDQAES